MNPVISKTGRVLARGLGFLARGFCHAALWPMRQYGIFGQMLASFLMAAVLAFTHPWR